MANTTLQQTAEEFRSLVRQAAERGRFNPPAAALDVDALAAAIRAAVADAVAASPPTAVGLDPTLVARLESVSHSLADRAEDGDVLLHLRNVLPGQIRQELQQQGQATQQRLAVLEQQIALVHAESGWGREIARALLAGIVVGIILLLCVIFEKPLQDWGRDNVYPLVGFPIREASPNPPRQANPAAPPERR